MKLTLKPKKCRNRSCRKEFEPRTSTQIACCLTCALALNEHHKEVKAKAEKRAEKRQDRAKREAMKGIKKLKAEAQTAFNRWVRLRDFHLGCVSCGEMNPPVKPGGQWDAGHFISRGSHPELAFEPLNVWKQCKSCNAGGGKFAHKERTVNEKYEQELLRRIGPEQLAWLKGPHEVKPLSRDDLIELTQKYRSLARELEKQLEKEVA